MDVRLKMIMLGYANLFGFYPALTTYANNVDLNPFKYFADFLLNMDFTQMYCIITYTSFIFKTQQTSRLPNTKNKVVI